MIDRRLFLGALAASAVPRRLLSRVQDPASRQGEFRTITYNVLACRGHPRTDANAVYLQRARGKMPERLAMELELYDPDLVTFQESTSKDLVARVAAALGFNYAYFDGGYPGTLMTPHEIVSWRNCPLVEGDRPEDLYTRHWGTARLRVHGEEIALYTAHLHPNRAELREREVTGMLAVMAEDLAANRSVILQGDLNHLPDGPEYPRWVEAGLVDAFAAKGRGQPLTIPSTEPERRIDYVWSSVGLAARLRECRVLYEGAFRTNPDDPRSFALSDHIPVMATFAASSG